MRIIKNISRKLKKVSRRIFNHSSSKSMMNKTAPFPASFTLRKGQTAIEYILVTVALVLAFAFMFKSLQKILVNEFKKGGIVILRVYEVSPW